MQELAYILHIDMDSYFASVEVRENPDLQGLPVVIGANPREGRGRGVVSTCSYEARTFGIRSGMPISQAYHLCPSARFLPVNFPLYYRTSERIMAIIGRQGTHLEQVSIDEAFLQLDGSGDISKARGVAERIQQELEKSEHLTCSIGIGPTRVVAKIASDYQKPNGLTIVPHGEIERFLYPLPVRRLPGIGKKTEEILFLNGIFTVGDLASRDVRELTGLFGKSGLHLYSLAHGKDIVSSSSPSGPRSMSREITFEVDTVDAGTLHAAMDALADEVHHTLLEEGLFFRTISVKVRYTGFITHTKSRSLHRPSNDRTIIGGVATSLLHGFQDGRMIRLIGLRLSNLSGYHAVQRSLVDFLPPHPCPSR